MTDDATALREDTSMHRHDHDREAAPGRPVRRSEHEDAATALAARAAAAGRTDALGQASVLRLQRAAGNAGVAQLLDGETEQESPVKEVVGRGGGTPLEPAVRQRMEASFGTDFSDVRVHAGGTAAASAQAVDAHAYTVGNEIVLGDGQTPGSASHERTLAHELTHVVQQRSGPVDGTPMAGGISVSDPGDRFERAAETTAGAVVSTGHAGTVAGDAGGSSVQRERQEEEEPAEGPQEVNRPEPEPGQVQRPEEEQEEVQQLAIQREEVPEGAPENEEEGEDVQALAIQRIRREGDEQRLLP
jgi:hypothetical protein